MEYKCVDELPDLFKISVIRSMEQVWGVGAPRATPHNTIFIGSILYRIKRGGDQYIVGLAADGMQIRDALAMREARRNSTGTDPQDSFFSIQFYRPVEAFGMEFMYGRSLKKEREYDLSWVRSEIDRTLKIIKFPSLKKAESL